MELLKKLLRPQIFPWIAVCYVFGIIGSLSILVAIGKMLRQNSAVQQLNQRGSFTFAWVFTGILALGNVSTVIRDFSKEPDPMFVRFDSYTMLVPAAFILGYILVGIVRAKQLGWVAAFSTYALDNKIDEREREIQYQATGISFSFLLVLILSLGVFLGSKSPMNQSALFELCSAIFWFGITLRGFVSWFLHRR